ncbi:hypothetical protein CAEBREN_17943 [Caenorhabditis brenneri]|uniref:Sdz-33 F-box domain-containing protein n=1 Tax=Caenorhabditis brenneri TaxID=135651 RepID=G0NQ63_CAEBE|nr:hypothetical protein CAEBREN_17943 [Caenorhabditis brenneri]
MTSDSMVATFPLFRLPYVAFSEVMNGISLKELVRMSLISRNSYKSAKFARRKSRNRMILVAVHKGIASVSVDYERIFEVVQSSQPKDSEVLKLAESAVPFVNGRNNSLRTFWGDKSMDINRCIDYITDFFNLPIDSLYLSATEEYPTDPRLIVDNVFNRQEFVNRCLFECDVTSDEELTYFLNQRNIRIVHLDVKPSDEFAFNDSFHWNQFFVIHGFWVTLPNILGMNCESIVVKNSRISNENMNMFLKYWIKGGCPQLKYMLIMMQTDLERIFEGVVVSKRENNGQVSYTYFSDQIQYFTDGYDVQREDGVMGTLIHLPNTQDGFYFVVWPDFADKPYCV